MTNTQQPKSGTDNGTSIAFWLLQLHFTHQPKRQSNMIPVPSRRRAVVKFLIECSLFVNQKVHYSITGMTKYYIKSESATMLRTRRQANGFNRLSILFYNNRGTSMCVSTIKISDGWTPKLFLGLLLHEWCASNVISLIPSQRPSMWWHLQDAVALLQP